MSSELWKDIPGEPHYQASDLGRIRSHDRTVRCKNGYRSVKGKILSPFDVKSTGYRQVDIRGKRKYVHRLVAMAWCDGYFHGACVDHINAVRSDNRAANLRWVTMSENQRHSYSLGRVTPTKGVFSGKHPTSKAVISLCLSTKTEKFWPSAMDAVRAGFDSSSISRCCSGKVNTHKGHSWRFANEARDER